MGNVFVSRYIGFTQGGLEYRPILGSGTPLPAMDEMKISPSGAGSFFHARKPVTYQACNGIVPWLGTHVTGPDMVNPPTADDAHIHIYVTVGDGICAHSFSAWWDPYGPTRRLFVSGVSECVPIIGPNAPVYSYDTYTMYREDEDYGTVDDLIAATLAVIATLPPYVTWEKRVESGPVPSVVDQVNSQKESPNFQFKYNELDDFLTYTEFGLWTQRWRTLAGNAYINAAQNLPSTANNSIQNVVQIIDLIKDIKEGNLGRSARDFVKSSTLSKAKEAWLSYRYSYETTKLDLQEYRELTERIQSLRSLKRIETFGQYASEVAFCRCCFKVNVSDMIPTTFYDWLHSYGFYLKAADVWDDIPFSFMVDWFLHLGDLLEFFDAAGEAAEVRSADVWYSFLTKYDGQTCYFRVPGTPIWNVPFLDFNKGSSNKVKAMRIADTISIFT